MDKDDGYNYTEYAKGKSDVSFSGNLASFYCQRDFVDILNKIDEAEPDNVKFWEDELDVMCKARGLDSKELLANRSILKLIPTDQKLLDQLIEMFYNNYKEYKSPEDYMTRIVRRCAPEQEYAKDSVRLVILKKFILGAGFDWEERDEYSTGKVVQWALEKFSDNERKDYAAKTDPKEQLEMIVNKLDESIFPDAFSQNPDAVILFRRNVGALKKWVGEKMEITTDENEVNAFENGDLTIDEVSLKPLEDISLRAETQVAIQNFCKENGLDYDDSDIPGKNLKNLNMIADKIKGGELSPEGKKALVEDVFPYLQKTEGNDFSHLKNETYYKTRANTLKKVDDAFDTYKKSKESKEIRSSLRDGVSKEWGDILRLCDDYAEGIFRDDRYEDEEEIERESEKETNKTRKLLYYFAIMFDMTVKQSENGKSDPETDLDKNLFRDYYNDNVLRYLKSYTSKGNGKFEAEPRGDGINYKNYAEVIYLYFLVHKEMGTPGKRIDQAEQLINYCLEEVKSGRMPEKSTNNQEETDAEEFTEFYREALFYEALKLDRNQFVNYILNNYTFEISRNEKTGKEEPVSPLKNAAEQVGAFEVIKGAQEAPYFGKIEPDFKKFMKSLLKDPNEITKAEKKIEEKHKHRSEKKPEDMSPEEQRLWLIPKYPSKKSKEWLWVIPDMLKKNKNEKYTDYVNDKNFMSIVKKLNERLADPRYFMSEKKITRNTYLSLFLYAYIQWMKARGTAEKGRTFAEIYKNFCEEANVWLEQGRFQLYNSTNIVDLYVFITFYAFLIKNIDLYDFEHEEKAREREPLERQREEQKEKTIPEEPEL